MVHIWRPHWSYEKIDPTRCASAVHDGGGSVEFHQCTRRGIIEEDGHLWCRVHAPSAEAERNRIASEKYEAERKRSNDIAVARSARNNIATVAIAYFEQKATHDDLERAVTEWREAAAVLETERGRWGCTR